MGGTTMQAEMRAMFNKNAVNQHRLMSGKDATMKCAGAAMALVTALVLTVALTGCGLNAADPIPVPGQQLNGMVHGGVQPVTGANITLYAPGTNGYGVAATSLLNQPV